MGYNILAINPGSTSTKIGWFLDDREVWTETIRHSPEDLAPYETVAAQQPFRLGCIERAVSERRYRFEDLAAVVGRGGIVDPIPGGTYAVGEILLRHLQRGKPWEHASNLGGIIGNALSDEWGIPAFIVDPVSVDEFDEVSRVTGFPELPKRSLVHALNIRAIMRRAAADIDRDWRKVNFIIAHLGGGISIAACRGGRIVDVNNANEFGPFSPQRTGGVPAGDLVRLCFSGKYSEKEILDVLVRRGGVRGYLGTENMQEVSERVRAGDGEAECVYRAMALQVAREIGSCAVTLEGRVEGVVLTGGVAHDRAFDALVTERVQWIAPVFVYPGEDELAALAQGAFRVLCNEEEALDYSQYAKEEA